MGMGFLPPATGILQSYAHGISADGTVVVGGSTKHIGAQQLQRAFLSDHTTLIDLGTLGHPDVPTSVAYDVSGDGLTVVGSVNRISGAAPGGPTMEAFVWKNGQMLGLGNLPGGVFSEARAVSANGGVVVGYSGTSSKTEAFRWEEGTMVGIGDLPGGTFSSKAMGVSADGSVIVGVANSGQSEAFRWENQAMTGLGYLPGSNYSQANAVSGDGAVVVGYVATPARTTDAFIWNAYNGMRKLQDVLVYELGMAKELAGWQLNRAASISPDARTIVGTGTNPSGYEEAWRVTLELPGIHVDKEYDKATNNVTLTVRNALPRAIYNVQVMEVTTGHFRPGPPFSPTPDHIALDHRQVRWGIFDQNALSLAPGEERMFIFHLSGETGEAGPLPIDWVRAGVTCLVERWIFAEPVSSPYYAVLVQDAQGGTLSQAGADLLNTRMQDANFLFSVPSGTAINEAPQSSEFDYVVVGTQGSKELKLKVTPSEVLAYTVLRMSKRFPQEHTPQGHVVPK